MGNNMVRKIVNKTTSLLISFIRFFILFGLSVIILYPLLNMFSVAFRPAEQMNDPLVMWIPRSLTMANIKQVFEIMEYPRAFVESLIVTLTCTVLIIVSTSLAGYGFARFKFKGIGVLFGLVIFTIVVPPQTNLISQYLDFWQFDFFGIGQIVGLFTGKPLTINLTDNYLTLFLPALLANGIKSGLYIYIFRQFFRNMPKELEDAAAIDGCSPLQTFLRIIVPNAGSSFITVFLFSFVWYWNDTVYIGMFMNESMTITGELGRLSAKLVIGGYNGTVEALVMNQAATLLSIAPLLVLYLFLQRYFTESIDRTGIVG